MTTLYASPIYISLTFIARFTCSNGLVCCVCDNVNFSDKAGFHAIEGVLGGSDGKPWLAAKHKKEK
jgi:hypothetical protein